MKGMAHQSNAVVSRLPIWGRIAQVLDTPRAWTRHVVGDHLREAVSWGSDRGVWPTARG